MPLDSSYPVYTFTLVLLRYFPVLQIPVTPKHHYMHSMGSHMTVRMALGLTDTYAMRRHADGNNSSHINCAAVVAIELIT